MNWSSFLGAFISGVLGVVITLGVMVAWDEHIRRKEKKNETPKPPEPPSLDKILESQLEQHIVQNFDDLFPGWSIYAFNVEASTSHVSQRLPAVRYRTEAGEIDILCTDSENNFVVIELKRNKAPDKVVAQTDRYIAWVKENMAQPNQQVRGLIIAKSLDKHLAYILSQRQNVTFWAYSLHLQFDKNAVQKALTSTIVEVANTENPEAVPLE